MKKSFRQLEVWKRAMRFAAAIYTETRCFPREEKYGLVSQMRRAAVSVPANIAEGHGRGSAGECRQFLCTARGSLMETETQLILSEWLGYISAESAAGLAEELQHVGRLLNGLIRYVDKQRIVEKQKR